MSHSKNLALFDRTLAVPAWWTHYANCHPPHSGVIR